MTLPSGSCLQGGRYRIEKVLGQGGFGITYLGLQTGLNRHVAIKEFFMKEYCNREQDTSRVTIATGAGRGTVEHFRQKFLKEAQTIALMDHPHVIRIHDIFEENGTAYYVMEHIGGGSLQDKVKADGPMPEREALRYIRQVGDALRYVHGRHVMHLDVKPSNILLRPDGGGAVLIDFGISKHYDEHGSQTSSSPVGISQGYAPLEQYQQGGVESFQPCTDIYSLGATLYFLLTGWRPPEATTVYDSGLPPLPPSVSPRVAAAVARAMSPRRADRPQSAEEFLRLLDDIPVPSPEPEQPLHVLVERDGEDTHVQEKPSIKVQEKRPLSKEKKIGAAAIVLLYVFWFCFGMFTEIFYDYWVNWWDKRNMLPNLVQIGMVAFMLWACYGKKLPPKPLFVSLLIFTGLYVGMYSRNIELMADYGGMASAMAYVYAWGTLFLLPSVCVYAWFKLEKGIPLSVYAKKVRRYLAPFLFLIMLAEGFAMFIVS